MFLDPSKCKGRLIQIISFWDFFSTIRLRVSFPFKIKILPFSESRESNNCEWALHSLPFLKVVCFSWKSCSNLQKKKKNLMDFLKRKMGWVLWTFISHSFWFGWKPIFFLMELQGEGRVQAWEGLRACSWRWRWGWEVRRCLSSSSWGIGDLEQDKSLYTLIALHNGIFDRL